MNGRYLLTLPAVVALALAGCSSSSNNNGYVPPGSQFTVQSAFTSGITAGATVSGMTGGPDGRVWFSQSQTPYVGATTTAGTVTQYPVLANSQTNGIVVGPDNNLWTGGYAGYIYQITTSGTYNVFKVPGAHYAGIAVGSDGNLWLGDSGNDKITRITTSGAYTQFNLPPGVTCTTVAAGPDGNLWFACNNQVLKVGTSGSVLAQYGNGITSGESLQYIISAPDGNLYATEYAASSSINDKIAKITTNGSITEIGTLQPQSYPNQLAIGSDQNVYFQEVNNALLGMVTLSSGKVTTGSIKLSNGDSGTQSIASFDGLLYLGGKQTIYAVKY